MCNHLPGSQRAPAQRGAGRVHVEMKRLGVAVRVDARERLAGRGPGERRLEGLVVVAMTEAEAEAEEAGQRFWPQGKKNASSDNTKQRRGYTVELPSSEISTKAQELCCVALRTRFQPP